MAYITNDWTLLFHEYECRNERRNKQMLIIWMLFYFFHFSEIHNPQVCISIYKKCLLA